MRLIQFEPLFIRHFSTSDWPFPLHNHNYYELMFIRSGAGVHLLNGVETVYSGRAVFFLSPDDKHDLVIKEETQFSVILFLPAVLKSDLTPGAMEYWDALLESLLRKRQENYEQWNASRSLNALQGLVDVAISEWQGHEQKVTELHVHLVRSMLLILKSNAGDIESNYGIGMVERIQNFIHKHIYSPEKLTVDYLSKTFGVSGSHLRATFKKEMRLSLTDYIQSLKIQLIKEHMEIGNKTLTEISQEFGFSDSSHFYKFFVRMEGVSPKMYKKKRD
ncbi:MAG: helix-turn-helix domain-containing protein [Bacteroidetes bacterium]|nr:helix-turn-helix domain-containing protein [Bacteroidota bacterium]